MRWSIFDPKNKATLEDVRQKYGVSVERLGELKGALAHAKSKIQRDTLPQSLKTSEVALAVNDAEGLAQFYSRKNVVQVFNQASLKAKIKGLIQGGVAVAYVGDVSAKLGAKRVYKLETDRYGRIKLTAAIPDNPQRVASSGLYSVTIVEASKKPAVKIYKSRAQSTGTSSSVAARKRRKPRVHFEAEIKA